MYPPVAPQSKLPKPTAIVLWLIFFFPIGLWLMWRDPRPALRLKQWVTAVFVAIIALNGIYSVTPAGRVAQAQQDKADAVAAAQQNAAGAEQAKADRLKQAAQEKQAARDEAAQQAEQQQQDKITESSLARMRRDFLTGSNRELVSAVETGDDPYEVRVTVKNEWFLRVHQIRLQSAQNLWAEWAQLRSPREPGRAYISIVDVNGNRVGGSGVLDGTAIKVDN